MQFSRNDSFYDSICRVFFVPSTCAELLKLFKLTSFAQIYQIVAKKKPKENGKNLDGKLNIFGEINRICTDSSPL